MDDEVCYCGHVFDEHEEDEGAWTCAVAGCPCQMFDLDEAEALN